MSPCTQHAAEIADVALGATPGPALSLHLDECPACTRELARQRALARRIAAAVNALVRAEPPSDLAARIVTRLRVNDSASSAFRKPRPAIRNARPTILVGATLAAAVLAAFFLLRSVLPPNSNSNTNAAAIVHWHSPTSSLLESRISVRMQPHSLRVTPAKPHSHATNDIGATHVS
jgi:anti-sigma factor RsiW